MSSSRPSQNLPGDRPIIYFDGVCGLCNSFVDFLLRRDKAGEFVFAPLQGETARERLGETDAQSLQTVVLEKDGQTWRRSAAIVRILWGLPGGWPVLGSLLWLVPGPLRDAGYRLVSRGRYRLFGKKDACRLPTPEERSRFLD